MQAANENRVVFLWSLCGADVCTTFSNVCLKNAWNFKKIRTSYYCSLCKWLRHFLEKILVWCSSFLFNNLDLESRKRLWKTKQVHRMVLKINGDLEGKHFYCQFSRLHHWTKKICPEDLTEPCDAMISECISRTNNV